MGIAEAMGRTLPPLRSRDGTWVARPTRHGALQEHCHGDAISRNVLGMAAWWARRSRWPTSGPVSCDHRDGHITDRRRPGPIRIDIRGRAFVMPRSDASARCRGRASGARAVDRGGGSDRLALARDPHDAEEPRSARIYRRRPRPGSSLLSSCSARFTSRRERSRRVRASAVTRASSAIRDDDQAIPNEAVGVEECEPGRMAIESETIRDPTGLRRHGARLACVHPSHLR
jgi:hypothetical protein